MTLQRRDVVLMPSGTQPGLGSAVDNFTDADNTPLQDHNPSSGSGRWLLHPSVSIGRLRIGNNRLHNENSTNSRVYSHSATPASPDYDVSCDIIVRSDNNVGSAGPCGRMSLVDATYYFGRYTLNGNAWGLFRNIAGVTVQLGSDVLQDLTIDQAYRFMLRMRGTTISLRVDGVEIISAVDDRIYDKGYAGLRLQQAATPTVGVHVDNFLAEDYAA